MSAPDSHDDSDVPVHADGVQLTTDGDGARLRADQLAEPLRLDPMALALWDLCDGDTTLGDMVRAATLLFDAPQEVVRRDIARALDALAAARALVWRRGAQPTHCLPDRPREE